MAFRRERFHRERRNVTQPSRWNRSHKNGFTVLREAEISKVPFLAVLVAYIARRFERRVARHTSEEQRRYAPTGDRQKRNICKFSISKWSNDPRVQFVVGNHQLLVHHAAFHHQSRR